MHREWKQKLKWLGAACALMLLPAVNAHAQLSGSHSLGDFGVQSGTQPAPGFYAALFYLRYDTDTIKDKDGNDVSISPGTPSSIGVNAIAPILWYVTDKKLFGANYGAFVSFPFANASLEAPFFGLGETVSTGFADMLVRPLDLGWHHDRYDIATGLEVYVPTGRYEVGASDNLGKGMWTWEPFLGATYFFDQKKTLSLATTAYWEIHGTKKDTDTKVGQILTLEGGLGKSYLGGGLIIGAAYYAQWKLTNDEATVTLPGGSVVDVDFPNKHRVYGIGPDITLPVASKSTLFALVNIRYLWETGARVRSEGQTLAVTATFPIPSVKL
jgi:hypothetical protein